MASNKEEAQKKPGPPPGPKREKYSLLLDKEAAEWGMHTEEGLSGIVRRLLKKEMARVQAKRDEDA